MTFEQTIQDLYESIADIEKFICKEEKEAELLGTVSYSSASSFPVPKECTFIVVNASRALYVSTIFDSLNSKFNEYFNLGFGSIRFFKDIGADSCLGTLYKINARSRLIERDKNCDKIHISPLEFTSGTIRFFGIVEPPPPPPPQ